MIDKEQILAALKKLGPSSPTAIANSMSAEPSAVGYHLRAMLKDKTLKAAGASNSRVYALPEQKFEAATGAPPQERKYSKRAKPAGTRTAEPVGIFLPAFTADQRLVVLNGVVPQLYSPEQTQAIADLLLQHFEV